LGNNNGIDEVIKHGTDRLVGAIRVDHGARSGAYLVDSADRQGSPRKSQRRTGDSVINPGRKRVVKRESQGGELPIIGTRQTR
jgi:hypothetical protein